MLKLHRKFAHPSAQKLYNLLERVGLEIVTPETLERLKTIVASCEPCQRIWNAPLWFRVSVGHENLRFNARAYIDIVYLDGWRALHIVDETTRFSAAPFLTKMSTESVWEAIILCWSSVYTGLPDSIIVDEGSLFWKMFAEIARLHDVNLQKTPVESHNSLGIGERYHKPLFDTYRKLKTDHPSMQRQLLLKLSVKAMNDTFVLEGTVRSASVFGEFSSLRFVSGPLISRPTLGERAEAAFGARRYMSQHFAWAKVKRALHHKPPLSTDKTDEPGDEVLVWGEK